MQKFTMHVVVWPTCVADRHGQRADRLLQQCMGVRAKFVRVFLCALCRVAGALHGSNLGPEAVRTIGGGRLEHGPLMGCVVQACGQ